METVSSTLSLDLRAARKMVPGASRPGLRRIAHRNRLGPARPAARRCRASSLATARVRSPGKALMTLEHKHHSKSLQGSSPSSTCWRVDFSCNMELRTGLLSTSPASRERICPAHRTRAHALREASTVLGLPAKGILSTPLQGLLEAQHDAACTLAAFVIALLWVRLWDELVVRGVTDSKLSRKLVHITTGLLFMLTWPFFSNAWEARFFAAAVPAANILRLTLLGLGITKNEAVVKAVSREGNPRELLRGPLFYVITIALVTIAFWRTSPVGAVALVMMCGGDGIADIVGRRWGSARLPWNKNKSWAGSLAMFALGSLLSMLFVALFCHLGFYECNWWSVSSCSAIALIALGATLVESLPISTQLDDNFTVPATSILIGLLLM